MYNCRAVKCLNVYSYLFDKLQFKSLYKMFQNALNRHWPYVFFTNVAFCFHVSFLYFNLLIINSFEG